MCGQKYLCQNFMRGMIIIFKSIMQKNIVCAFKVLTINCNSCGNKVIVLNLNSAEGICTTENMSKVHTGKRQLSLSQKCCKVYATKLLTVAIPPVTK